MLKSRIYKVIQYSIITMLLMNVSGCATSLLWQVEQGTPQTTSLEAKASSSGLYAPCDKTVDSTYIAYKVTDMAAGAPEFPPFVEGFVVLANNHVVKRVLTDLERKKYYAISEAAIGKIDIVNSDDTPRYYYSFYIADKDGNIKDEYGSRYQSSPYYPIQLSFVNKDEIADNVLCEQLNNRPFNFGIRFFHGSKSDSKQKFNPLIVVIATPFSVALDIVTSPIQLLLLLYVVSHASPA